MKNFSIGLNIILLVAVIVLYVLHFSGGKTTNTKSSSSDTSAVDLKVAYINSDTVLKYYEYLKVNKQQLEERTKKMDQDYRNRAMGLQNEIAAYQRNVKNMTYGQVQATEEDLGKKQQNLQMYQQSLAQQLMQEEAKLNKELYDRVTAFLKNYGEEKGLQLVLKYDPTSDMLYGSNVLDITKEVIDGLNDSYKKEGAPAASATKTDTTKKSK
ncbi:OmpH family outer membrane protein [Chryseosolibacter indicus]|uniref:OmpH family outer membrane protein n=1 Tax=Chryseosolibacter indicus TaxID=2782351 RepID=A0ABS5VRI8_9BACT|nr:OmpH family outer membrane protein [Chryseosolibacter indicus]MBT1703643.1 OmpH family outer membrane protein [Chryseosolibacter indicus]